MARALKDAVRARGLPYEAFDGMAVRVDEGRVYEPEATLRCEEPLDDDAVKFSDPVVVVEVLSPSTQARDARANLQDYFRLPSVRRYPILRTDTRSTIHDDSGEDGVITTAIVSEGALRLDPPRIAITLEVVFADGAAA